MANVKEYSDIIREIKSGIFKPIYLLHGEEPFYIDRISDLIEQNALEEHERDFNLSVYYGRDVNELMLLESLKRFPMMAQRQVVILREAQDYQGDWDNLTSYFEKPFSSTVFVIDYKYKKVDERKKWVKLLKQNSVVFHSAKHYDNELPLVITEMVKSMKYRINASAALLMAEYLGNDLEKIEGELKKLMIKVPLSREIEQGDVRENIGISKEFSPFDLVDALAERNAERSFQIAHFIGKNEKNAPLVLVTSSLFQHFAKVFMYQTLKDKSLDSVSRSIPGVKGTWMAKRISQSAQHYSAKKCADIIEKLREIDARFKGVNAVSTSEAELLKELTFFILK